MFVFCFFFSSRRRHTISYGDWSSDVCSSDLFCPGTELLICSLFAIERDPLALFILCSNIHTLQSIHCKRFLFFHAVSPYPASEAASTGISVKGKSYSSVKQYSHNSLIKSRLTSSGQIVVSTSSTSAKASAKALNCSAVAVSASHACSSPSRLKVNRCRSSSLYFACTSLFTGFAEVFWILPSVVSSHLL